MKAAEVISFFNFALNLRKWYANPKTPIHIIISQDATCSGLQHISSMLYDTQQAKQVNTKVPSIDGPIKGDVYTDIANRLSNINQPSEQEYLVINRKFVKKPVKTLPYGVTERGKTQQKKDNAFGKFKEGYIFKGRNIERSVYLFEAKPNTPKKYLRNGMLMLRTKDLFTLSLILKKLISNTYTAVPLLKVGKQTLTRIMAKLNIPISWQAPSGLQITQHYNKYDKVNIPIRFGVVIKSFVSIQYEPNTIEIRSQTNAIVPNYVHSFDSSLIIKLIHEQDKTFITVHDCFGCNPNDKGLLRANIIRVFAEMYLDKEYLKDFYYSNINHMKEAGIEVITETIQIDDFITIPLSQAYPNNIPVKLQPDFRTTHYIIDPNTGDKIAIPPLPKQGSSKYLKELKFTNNSIIILINLSLFIRQAIY